MKDKTVTFTGRQIAAGRALVGMWQEELAAAAGISAPTLRRMELAAGVPTGMRNNLLAVQAALSEVGVEFFEDGQSIGVRLKKPETAADLTRQIDAMEADLARSKGPSAQTPAGGMQRLERARKANVVTKLKNRRTKISKKGK